MSAFAQMLEVALGVAPDRRDQAPFEASLRTFENALADMPERATEKAATRLGRSRVAAYETRWVSFL